MRPTVFTLFAALMLAGCSPSQSEIETQNTARDAELLKQMKEADAKHQQELRKSSARFNTGYAK